VAESADARYERRLLAVFGDRVDLERLVVSAGPAGGRFEVEYRQVTEVDEAGQIVLRVTFEPGDWRAAQREALARVMAGDAVAAVALAPLPELLEALADLDHARMRALLADDLVYEDHRRTGVGRVDGVAAFLESIAATWGLVRGFQIDVLSIRAIERRRVVMTLRASGTLAEGGEFESLFAAASVVEDGLVTRIDMFEIDQLDAALARLAELRPDAAWIRSTGRRACPLWTSALRSTPG
jgi:hypothetical protein